jgi:hypothetical protein
MRFPLISSLSFSAAARPACACSLHHVVRICKVEPHGRTNFFLTHAHDAVYIAEYQFKRSIVEHTASHSSQMYRLEQSGPRPPHCGDLHLARMSLPGCPGMQARGRNQGQQVKPMAVWLAKVVTACPHDMSPRNRFV